MTNSAHTTQNLKWKLRSKRCLDHARLSGDVMDRKYKGAFSELRAAAWLLEQGYQVFRNVSSHGDTDIIAIRDDKIERFDVKTAPSGIIWTNHDVKLLLVHENGSCEIREATERPKRVCKKCGATITYGIGPAINRKWCSNECRSQYWQEQRPEPPPRKSRKDLYAKNGRVLGARVI
jgi:hypothetical protein